MAAHGETAQTIATAQSTMHRVPISTTFVQPATMEYHGVIRADLELKLYKNNQRVRKRDFSGPAAGLLAVVLAFATSDFHKAFGIPADLWAAVFAFIGVACAYKILLLTYSALVDRPLTVEKLADQILDIEKHLR